MFPGRSVWNLGLGAAVLGGIVLSFILGPERVSREMRASVQRAEQAFDKSVSNAQLIATARVTLRDYEENCHKLEESQHEIDDRIAEARGIVSQAENELKQHEDVLRLAKVKLVGNTDTFEINGRSFSRTEVERDAEKRLQFVRDAAARIATEQETLKRLEQIRSDVATNLSQLQTVRADKNRELELLASRIKNAEVIENIENLSLKFDHATGEKSKFEQSVAEIERRIRDAERRATRGSNKSDLIDWTSTKRDLVAEIDVQLKKVPATPAVVQK